ncbi:MAG: hypothetical protein HKN85_00615 [Gammaproteobacteria bacterium]|nr:hypothetical protein [Gammaproteobacteria bacterium]
MSGTVEDQFQEWQRILSEMFRAENGLDPIQSGEAAEDTSTSQQSSTSQLKVKQSGDRTSMDNPGDKTSGSKSLAAIPE